MSKTTGDTQAKPNDTAALTPEQLNERALHRRAVEAVIWGPVVIDSPEGVYGVIDDFWQRPIVEVGPFGPDKGKGGKFLLLPPGFSGSVPDGYLPAPSLAYRHIYVGRAFVKDGNVAAAVKTLEGIRVYPLSQASAPAKTRVLRSGGKPMNSIPPQHSWITEDVMTDIDTALNASNEAIQHLLLAGERTRTAWTSPRAPGKWSPSQIRGARRAPRTTIFGAVPVEDYVRFMELHTRHHGKQMADS